MTINGKIGSFSRNDVRAAAPGHGPVLMAGSFAADDGEYPSGLLLTGAADSKLKPLIIAAEVLGAGDGNTKAFAGTLTAGLPVEPGTVEITDGVEVLTDDGHGRISGDAGGTGVVDYRAGEISVEFNANVADGAEVHAGYVTRFDGVLNEDLDTAKSTSGIYIPHGTVRREALKVGRVEPEEPDERLLRIMQARGVYPM